jgi:acyl carrier protein
MFDAATARQVNPMREIDKATTDEIRAIVYDYFAEECDFPRGDLTDATDIISELDGDSLMLLALLDVFRKKYGLTIELKTLGKHLMKRPANTVGQVVELTVALVRFGDDIVNQPL